jgi:methionyl-tRNA formyltransferase
VIPEPPWRVAIVTRILPVFEGFHAVIREAGHEPVALLTVRDPANRYGDAPTVDRSIRELPGELNVLMPADRASLAPLLASVEPDLAVCMGFPWKVPAEALAVPRLGWLNGHPSLLPRHRGPVPVAWAIRNGDEEIGITFHRMDADLDTGPILAQRPIPLGEYAPPEEFYPRMGAVVLEVLRDALGRLAAGEDGAMQDEGGEYESFFTDDDAWLDPARPAEELHRLVWAWRFTVPMGLHGALVELDGEVLRVLASSLAEVEGAVRLECADAPLWLVSTEPAQAGAATAPEAAVSS